MKPKPALFTLLFFSLLVVSGKSQEKRPTTPKLSKPRMADTIKANVYADNTFELHINGELTAVPDSGRGGKRGGKNSK